MPKKTIEQIVKGGNDYLIKVKVNQPKLLQQLSQHTQQQSPRKSHRSTERTRNRKSQRLIQVFAPPLNLDVKWSKVGCILRVERTGTRADVSYQRVAYYLCSLAPHARHLAKGLRQHWHIENRLHWVKDVVLHEDASPKLAGLATINLSLLKTWVLTMFRIHGYDSLTEAISFLSHDIKQLLCLCH